MAKRTYYGVYRGGSLVHPKGKLNPLMFLNEKTAKTVAESRSRAMKKKHEVRKLAL